jgi:hypothetical protein
MIIYNIFLAVQLDGSTITFFVIYNSDGSSTWIPEDVDNTDYINFKAQINDESAQLEDADGVLMSPEAAKAYVATLP